MDSEIRTRSATGFHAFAMCVYIYYIDIPNPSSMELGRSQGRRTGIWIVRLRLVAICRSRVKTDKLRGVMAKLQRQLTIEIQ